MPVGNSSPVAKPGSRLRELGLVLPEASTPLGAYVEASESLVRNRNWRKDRLDLNFNCILAVGTENITPIGLYAKSSPGSGIASFAQRKGCTSHNRQLR